MSETKHSPEPWVFDAESGDMAAANGDLLMSVFVVSDANARRIVACVNACKGIPTESLEAGKLAEALRLLEVVQEGAEKNNPSPNLAESRALLRALGRLP